MWRYLPDLLARPVPRYTSYPTAVEFSDALGEAEHAAALEQIGHEEPLSLYVHIPFCQEICWYCGCNTARANKSQRLNAYFEALLEEIRLISGRLGGRGRVTRIAFGGGSPNALSPVDFSRLVNELVVAFQITRPVLSVEIDPRSFGKGWALALGRLGGLRVSLGVQTFDPAIQAAIGRVQPHATIVDAVTRLRDNGVGSINFDLMYGLPGQTIAALDATLDETIRLQPERIALFGYAHVPQMLPRQRRIDATDLPDQEARFAMAAHGHARLVAAGYEAIGFDHFALPGDAIAAAAREGRLRRNFQGFTEDQAETLIGLGASAISQFPDRIVQNEKNSGRYRMRLSAGKLPVERGVRIDAEDAARGEAIMGLLCGRSVDVSPWLADKTLRDGLHAFILMGVAVLDGSMLAIPPEGLPYARSIAALLDRYRNQPAQRFSSAI